MSFLAYGALGGLLPDAIRLIRARHDPEIPAYLKSPTFYVGLVLCVLLGAVAAKLLGAEDIKQALAYGFSAPEILTRILVTGEGPPISASMGPAGAPPGSVRTPSQPISMRDWWRR